MSAKYMIKFARKTTSSVIAGLLITIFFISVIFIPFNKAGAQNTGSALKAELLENKQLNNLLNPEEPSEPPNDCPDLSDGQGGSGGSGPNPEEPSEPTEECECPFYRFSVDGYLYNDYLALPTDKDTGLPLDTTVTRMIQEFVDKARNYCTKIQAGFFDDCVASCLATPPGEVGHVEECSPNLAPTESFYTCGAYMCGIFGCMCVPGAWSLSHAYYFDHQGNLVTEIPKDSEICYAQYMYIGSPISLLWSDDVDIERDVAVTTFPVNPAQAGKWFTWKASSQAPLLVYDPEHTGEITSAFQLFGNWTFGGKSFASLMSSDTPVSNVAVENEWEDGYEALATMDLNGDGEISGPLELEPLALWFDNKDGVSQKGEVKRLDEVGVTVLYYNPDKKEEATKSIIATKGYERIVAGKRITGTSVDWFSESATTGQELLNKHLFRSSLGNTNSATNETSQAHHKQAHHKSIAQIAPSPTNSTNPHSEYKASQVDIKKNFSGLWKWKSIDKQFGDDTFTPRGFLGFTDTDDGTIRGHSYVQAHFPRGYNKAESMFGIYPIIGTKIRDDSETTKIEFTVHGKGGRQVTSEAELLYGGVRMTGKTTAITNYKGKQTTMSYNWEAVRY